MADKRDTYMVPIDLGPEDQLRNARRIARDKIAIACRDARLAQQLEELDGVPTSTLNQEIYKTGLLEAVRVATSAMTSVKVGRDAEGEDIYGDKPHDSLRLKAIELLLTHRIEEGKLHLLAREQAGAAAGGDRPRVAARLVTKEQLVAEEQKQRALEKARKEQMT